MRARRSVLIVALGTAIVGSGCAPEPDVSACAAAAPDVIAAIQERVTEGTLHAGGTATGADGAVFISAALDRPGEDQDDDVLTWIATGDGYQSVDEQARDHSTWPEAEVDVRADGARDSRACAVKYREATTTTTGS